MATLDDLIQEYRKKELIDLASTEGKRATTTKTREEAPTGIEALKTMMGQAETELGTREKALGSLMDASKAKPERDLLAEALLAFAPALVGYGLGRASGGVGMAETGIAAGAQAGLSGLERLEKGREEEKKMAAEKLKLRPEYKAYETAAEKAKLLQKSYYDALGAGKKVTETDIQDVNIKRLKEEQKKASKSDSEKLAKLNDADKAEVKAWTEKKVKARSVGIQLESFKNQLLDPSIPIENRIKAGEEMLKLLNTAANEAPDAIQKEEAIRFGSFLENAIIPRIKQAGKLVGRDTDAFNRQVKLSLDRVNRNAAEYQKQIDAIYARQGQAAPSAAAAPPSTKAPRSAADIQKEIDELEKGRK